MNYILIIKIKVSIFKEYTGCKQYMLRVLKSGRGAQME